MAAVQEEPDGGHKQKIPCLRKGIFLRSVADSNRCNWFCRPAPSHSANRPCTTKLQRSSTVFLRTANVKIILNIRNKLDTVSNEFSPGLWLKKTFSGSGTLFRLVKIPQPSNPQSPVYQPACGEPPYEYAASDWGPGSFYPDHF